MDNHTSDRRAVSAISKRNVLVLRGRLNASGVLNFLDRMAAKVAQESNLNDKPQPWQLFSFFCADGTSGCGCKHTSPPSLTSSRLLAILLGYLEKSTADCRLVLEDLRKEGFCSSVIWPPWTCYHLPSRIRQVLEKHCGESRLEARFKKELLFGSGQQCDT